MLHTGLQCTHEPRGDIGGLNDYMLERHWKNPAILEALLCELDVMLYLAFQCRQMA